MIGLASLPKQFFQKQIIEKFFGYEFYEFLSGYWLEAVFKKRRRARFMALSRSSYIFRDLWLQCFTKQRALKITRMT